MNNKMIKTANGLHTFFKVFKKILEAATIVLIAIGAIFPFVKDKMLSPTSHISFGPLELVLANPVTTHATNEILLIEAAIVSALVLVIVSWLMVKSIIGILSPMKEGTPFEKGVSNNIRKIGVLSLVLGFMVQVLEMAITGVSFVAFDVESLINSSNVSTVNYDYQFNFSFILVAFLVFLLSYVFKYGEELQRESDETL